MSKIREIWSGIPFYNDEIDEQIEINAHYRGYLVRQNADILAFKRDENLLIPKNIDYNHFFEIGFYCQKNTQSLIVVRIRNLLQLSEKGDFHP